MISRYQIIKTEEDLDKLIEACKITGYASVDFETNAQPLYNESFQPTLLSVTFQAGSGCAIPLNHFEMSKRYRESIWKRWLIKFGREVIENEDITKIAWNWKFDNQIFVKYGIYVKGTVIDGILAKYLLNEHRPNGLKDMVRKYLPEFANYESSLKDEQENSQVKWEAIPLEELSKYGCLDTDCTFRLTIFLEKKLIELDMYNILRNLYMPMSRVLQDTEKNGIYLDREFNHQLLSDYKPKIEQSFSTIYNLPKMAKIQKVYTENRIEAYIQKIVKEIDTIRAEEGYSKKVQSREQRIANVRMGIFTNNTERDLNRQINLKSNKDLQWLLYNEEGFHFPIIKYSESNAPSTDEETLTNLRLKIKNPDSPKAIFLDSLLSLRGLQKMYATYIEGWSKKVQDDSRLHGKYLIFGTESNRLSSSDPNLQQIPKTSVDPNIKKQLKAPEGQLYFVMDFSQAELRMMAHLSKDETYLKAFAEGADPHLAIAAQKYGVPYEEAKVIHNDEKHPDHKLWKNRRKQAKQIAFGLIYGIQAKLLSTKLSDPKEGLIVTPEEAQEMMNDYFAQHPAIKKFAEKQEKILRRDGYLTSLFGTKRRLPEIYSNDPREVAYAIRLSLNFPCLLPSSQALSKKKGWVSYEDLEVGDDILAFNRDIGKSEWQKVERVNVFDYDGDMIRLKTKHLDVLSTPDHRWVVTKPSKISHLDKTEVLTSEELYNSDKPYAIPIRAPHNNSTLISRYSDTYVAFLGWYLTDGCLRGNTVRIYQSNTANPHKVDIIDSIMEELGIEFSRKETNQVRWEIKDPEFVYGLNRLVPERKLNMELLTQLTNEQLNILLENMRLGDGWSVWATGNKTQGELLQALVVLCNNTSSMYELSHEGDISYFKGRKPSKHGQEFVRATKTSYGVKFSNFRKSVNTKNTYNSENNLTKEKYQGKVWCPTVKSGAFFTRVIGEDKRYRTLITGNCQSPASNMTQFGSVLQYWDMKRGKFPPMAEVATVHDAVYYNTDPKYINVYTVWKFWDTFRNPKTQDYFGFQIDDVDMEMDFTIGRSMAEELPFIPGYDYSKMLQANFNVDEYMEEYKQFRDIPIKEYPKVFSQLFKTGKRWKRLK